MRHAITCILTFFLLTSNAYAHTHILESTQGKKIPFSSLKGKWVYINYWASWCAPCLHEIPEFNHFYSHYKDKNIAVFGVNYDGLPLDEQLDVIKQFKLKYPSLAHDPKDMLRLGDIQGVPVTFIFNPEGKLHDVRYGEQTERSLSHYLLD